MSSKSEFKRAVVLSGGGANGAYEAGVLKALFGGESPASDKKPFEADMFTGTSVGSYNAGYLVSQTTNGADCLQAAKDLEQIWIDRIAENPEGCNNGAFRIRADFLDYLSPKCFFKAPAAPFREIAEDTVFFANETRKRATQFFGSQEGLAQRSVELFDLSTALSTKPLHDLVTETIDLAAILSPKAKELFVVATNWDKGKPLVFQNHDVVKAGDGGAYDVQLLTKDIGHSAILASTAIPGVFPPVTINLGGKPTHFVDGGVLMNTPLSPAIRAKADEIHIIYFDPKLETLPANYLPNTLDTTNRFLFIALAAAVNQDIGRAIEVNNQVAVAQKIQPMLDHLSGKGSGAKIDKDVKDALEKAKHYVENLAGMKHVTIHKHYPSKSLGGILGLLNFKKKRMIDLVELGFNDAVGHDCQKNGCALRPE